MSDHKITVIKENLSHLPEEIRKPFLEIIDEISPAEIDELYEALTCKNPDGLLQIGLKCKQEMERNLDEMETIKEKFLLNQELNQ